MTDSSDKHILSPKEPVDKDDPRYMRRAYLYTGILLVIAIIGGAILAGLIIDAEQRNGEELDEMQELIEDNELAPTE